MKKLILTIITAITLLTNASASANLGKYEGQKVLDYKLFNVYSQLTNAGFCINFEELGSKKVIRYCEN